MLGNLTIKRKLIDEENFGWGKVSSIVTGFELIKTVSALLSK